jgi:hypothetical protein
VRPSGTVTLQAGTVGAGDARAAPGSVRRWAAGSERPRNPTPIDRDDAGAAARRRTT